MHPKKLGRYDLIAVLGKGAMGVVYEGRDPNLDRTVAIKTIMVDDLAGAAAADYEARFRTEARSAARLQHPNIVTVYDSDRDGGTAFLVMEFIQGEDLKHHLDRGERFGVADSLRLVQDLLAALDFAHAQGIIHRDVKPANLLIEPSGRLKLTDFGVARITGEATRTQGSMIGTLKYMAPEQVQGQKVDARADLFSAAIVAYQLFTNTRPFDGDNDFSIIHQIIGHDPAPPSSVAPEVPAQVDAVIARAMAKMREHRYQTAGEFSQALQQAFAGASIVASAQASVKPAPARAPSAGIGATIPGAPITQELELEYWRDVRASTDRHELEGFLTRFPQGIYADLARRRLLRLATDQDDPDRTVLQGMTRPPAPPPPPVPQADHETSRTATARSSPVLPDGSLEAAAPVPPAKAPERRSRKFAPVVAGLMVLVLGAGAAALWLRSPVPGAGGPSSPAALPAAPVVGSVTPSVPAVPASLPTSAATNSLPAVTAAAAPAPRAQASAARPVRRPAAASETAASPAVAEQPAPAAEVRRERTAPPAAAPSGVAAATAGRSVSPAETCRDKVFLMKALCLQEECARPGYQSFPICVRLREEARLREDSRVRN